MGSRRALGLGLGIVAALALTHCGWLLGLEPGYTVGTEAGGDAPLGDDDAAPTPSGADGGDAAFGSPFTLVTGEAPPFGGIAVANGSVYWTHAGVDGGVRRASLDGGPATTIAAAQKRGIVGEILAAGGTVHWREEEGDCAPKTRCGDDGAGGFGICGAAAVRLRADSRRLYLLLDQSAATAKYPVAILTKDCPKTTELARIFPDASHVAYSNIAPDRSGNRVFSVTGTSVDCLPVGGGPTVRVASGNVLDLAADDGHLYWLTPSEVHRCRFASDTACGPCLDEEVLTKTRVGSSAALVLDDTTLYWLVVDGIASLPVDAPAGATPTAIVSGQPEPAVFGVDPAGITWADSAGTISRIPRR